MDMDDPWGSPWAEEIQHSVIATKEKTNSEVRLKTPVKASSSGLQVKTNSPWDDEDDDDDGFGEWAAVPTEDVTRNGLGFDGAGGAWETRQYMDDRKEAKEGFNGLALGWNDNTNVLTSEAPKLALNLTPISAQTVRLPSPDPWAAEKILNDEYHEDEVAKVELHGHGMEDAEDDLTGRISIVVGKETETQEETLPRSAEIVTKNGTTVQRDIGITNSDGKGSLLELDETIPGTNLTEERSLENSSSVAQGLAPEPSVASEEVNYHDAGHESSRPSSSAHSHHGDMLIESPRTSLDEEPKRLQAPRKVSSKIQELVEHFDGLAKLEEDLVIPPNRSRSRSKTPSEEGEKILEEPVEPIQEDEKVEGEDEADNFGDFEYGQSEIEEMTEEAEVERPITPTSTQKRILSSPESIVASLQALTSPLGTPYVKRYYGRLEFAVDASQVDKINPLPDADNAKDGSTEKVFIMDTIPYDSFASTEERKAWYRISRYGSMRKHNLGDDENYTRVTWPQSQVREKTLKTVARWMEEDRVSGRVVLGGGSRGSSIFGWNNPSTPAVPLESVFVAKRGNKTPLAETTAESETDVPREWPKGLVRERSTSKGRSTAKSAIISDNLNTNTQKKVANFGWMASPASKTQPSIPLSSEASKAESTTLNPKPPSHQGMSPNPPPTVQVVLTPMETTQLRKPANLNRPYGGLTSKSSVSALQPILATDSNEDDWGEMQSSPIVSTSQALPSSQGLRNEKSQSLNGTFSPSLQSPPIDSPISLPQQMPDHKIAINLDDILMPKPETSSDSRLEPLPSNALTPLPSSSFFSPRIQSRSAPAAVISATNNNDPWASADFSFFDPPARAPKPAPAPAARPAPPRAISFAKAPPAPSPLRYGKTKLEIEQDEIVAGIVKSLPDLSYMLRR